jgi:Zn-dependent M28 family amino/carboxypeptidase
MKSQNRKYDALPVQPMIYPWSEGTECKPIFDVKDGAFKQLIRVAEENQSIAVKCSYTLDDHYKVPNVVGCIPGSDDKPESGQIILGAHFDAMGDNKVGTYNSGSLDNASGTAAIMEMARLLNENKVPPKKTIVFVAFNGEEQYLKGSHYYAENPVLPLDNSVLINLDMIGSTRKTPLTISAEGGKNTELLKRFCSTARELKLDTLPMAGGLCDGMSFAEKGVPTVSLVNLTRRGGYHTPNDNEYDVDKLRMEQYVKLILRYIDEYAY